MCFLAYFCFVNCNFKYNPATRVIDAVLGQHDGIPSRILHQYAIGCDTRAPVYIRIFCISVLVSGGGKLWPKLSTSYVFPTTTGTRLWHMSINFGTIRTSRCAPVSIQNDYYSPI